MTLDISPVEVRGPVRGHKARVIWADGNLYVARGSQDVTVFPGVPEPTRTDPKRHVYESEAVGLSFYRRGCGSCGYSLGRVPAEELISRAHPLTA